MSEDGVKYYMPPSVTVGMFGDKAKRKMGFVTCKFMDKGWLRAATFERLTGGYKPSQSKDPETELRKAVCGKAASLANDAVEGFRVTGDVRNAYGYRTKEYIDAPGDFILSDPRGFDVGISPREFASMVASGSVSGGAISGKYAYAWRIPASGDKTLVLLREGTAEYESARGEYEAFASRERPQSNCVKRRDLAVGEAYRAAKVLQGDWVYAGVSDTYSSDCHLKAFDDGEYDLAAAAEREKGWPVSGAYSRLKTGTGKMVFFPVKYSPARPYAVRTDVSGMFVPAAKPGGFELDGRVCPPTAESIAAALASCPAFQKIDFARAAQEGAYEPMDVRLFKALTGTYSDRSGLSTFPFDRFYGHFVVKCGRSAPYPGLAGKWLKISAYSYSNSKDGSVSKWQITNLTAAASTSFPPFTSSRQPEYVMCSEASPEQLYSAFNPVVPVLYFENGNKVHQRYSMMFAPAEIRSAANRCY